VDEMKISTQTAAVACTAIVTIAGLVFGLATFAHMDDGALIGLATAAGAVLGNLVVQLRSNVKLAAQDRQLDTIVKQTNGLSERERQDIAERAVAALIEKLREEKGL